jgi:hypothetical protein
MAELIKVASRVTSGHGGDSWLEKGHREERRMRAAMAGRDDPELTVAVRSFAEVYQDLLLAGGRREHREQWTTPMREERSRAEIRLRHLRSDPDRR